MLARVLTLRFNTLLDGFDDAPLRDFIKDKEVLAIRDHFFVKNEAPYLAVIVSYRPLPVAAAREVKPANGQSSHKRDESWREYVAESDVPLFNALRDWRNERSRREGLLGTCRSYALSYNGRADLGGVVSTPDFERSKTDGSYHTGKGA